MKTKRFNKKLSLQKQTITNLNSNELNSVEGGISQPNCHVIVKTLGNTCKFTVGCQVWTLNYCPGIPRTELTNCRSQLMGGCATQNDCTYFCPTF